MKKKAQRIYNHTISPFSHEPVKDRVSIVGTIEKGQGLVSLVDIEAGDIVFRFKGRMLNHQTLFTLQKAPGIYVEDPLVMGKVLHACDPNMVCDMGSQTFTANRKIRAGEFLTMDYETTEDELFRSFECGCGASECRGFIQGKVKSQHLMSA